MCVCVLGGGGWGFALTNHKGSFISVSHLYTIHIQYRGVRESKILGGAEYHVAIRPRQKWRVWEGGCAPSHAEHEENFAEWCIHKNCIKN